MLRRISYIVNALKEQEELITVNVKYGRVTIADSLQIQLKLADAENTLLSAEHSYDLSRINLC